VDAVEVADGDHGLPERLLDVLDPPDDQHGPSTYSRLDNPPRLI
jgi:hypothetical protein